MLPLSAQDSDILSKLESRLGEDSGSSAPTPLTSPPGSFQDSSSVDMFDSSQPTTASADSNDPMVLDIGVVSSPVDIEGWDEEEEDEEEEGGDKGEEEEDVDLLLQDLEHSSSSNESSDEEEEEEMEDDDGGL